MQDLQSKAWRVGEAESRELRFAPQESRSMGGSMEVQEKSRLSMRELSPETSAERSGRKRAGRIEAARTVDERVELTVLQIDTGAKQEAKRLSRIYQRDARRYDGGFALY